MIPGASSPRPEPTEQGRTTALYDRLFEAIRDGRLGDAVALWNELDDLLRGGAPLPSPWSAARVPRPLSEE